MIVDVMRKMGSATSRPRYNHELARRRMIDQLRKQGISQSVLEAMLRIPRHQFVSEAFRSRAYDDTTLQIGFRQTISKPSVVAKMTDLACQNESRRRILEIGTGCGYQTAILSCLFDEVYSIERIAPLVARATRNLAWLNCENVHVVHADGSIGWQANQHPKPFDVVIATCAVHQIPNAWRDHLSQFGSIIAPVIADKDPRLNLLKRHGFAWKKSVYELVEFVPLLHGTDTVNGKTKEQ